MASGLSASRAGRRSDHRTRSTDQTDAHDAQRGSGTRLDDTHEQKPRGEEGNEQPDSEHSPAHDHDLATLPPSVRFLGGRSRRPPQSLRRPPLSHVAGVAPQHPLQLLGRQPAPSLPAGLLLGALDVGLP